jgi:hypothetical protein
MRDLFRAAWHAPAPSAVPGIGHHLAVALASFVFAVMAHAGLNAFGI